MPATIKCTQIGQDKTRMTGAFDKSAVFIGNTHKVLDNAVWLSIQVFWTKKDAISFCDIHGFSKSLIRAVESRWQKGYAVGMGRDFFAPVQAEARLIAHRMGCIVDSVEIEK
jgi:hypothetical protein